MAKVIALGGAGHIGSCGVRELVRLAPEVDVVIADYNLEAAEKLKAEVGGRISVQKVDANNPADLVRVMSGADIVLNTVGPYYKYGLSILKAAIEAKANIVDVCDDGDATLRMLGLDKEAQRAGISAIVGMGATPGITNLMSSLGASKLDAVEDIDTSWAWSSIDPKMTGPAIVDHFFHAITGEVDTFRMGEWVKIPAVSNPKRLRFVDPIGFFEVAEVGHPEPVTLPRYIKGVKNVTNRGGVWPEKFMQMAMFLKEMGLPSETIMNLGGHNFRAQDVATQLILSLPTLAGNMIEAMVVEVMGKYGQFGIEGVALRVDIKGEKDGKLQKIAYGCGAPADFLTSYPSVIGAVMLLKNQITIKGVAAPEGMVDPELFFAELTRVLDVEEEIIRSFQRL